MKHWPWTWVILRSRDRQELRRPGTFKCMASLQLTTRAHIDIYVAGTLIGSVPTMLDDITWHLARRIAEGEVAKSIADFRKGE